MQNTNTAVIENNTAANATVGLNDAATTAGAAYVANYKRIEQLVTEREVWEQGVMRTSNEQLYALLGKCYALYGEMCADTEDAKKLRSALNDYIGLKGYVFTKATHTLTKIVKCVFGVDRRRVSTYSLVLREALTQKKKTAEEVAAFIAGKGGVEEIRRSKSATAKTAKQKAELGKQAIGGNKLAVVDSSKIAERLDLANVGGDMVAIVTQQADGSLIVRALVNNATVLNAALACAYSATKADEKKAAANDKAANDDKMLDEQINAAANA
jgi:hypothetical protein